jgi:alanine racemase
MKGAVMRPFRLYSDTPSLPTSKVWAEIDTVALQNNYKILCDRIPDVRHICVVKADSYGHTSAICVDVLLDAGCDFFAVSCIEEAIEVRSICRAKNRHADILILGYTDPRYAKELCEHDIIQSVISKEHGLLLSREAETAGCRIRVHIALDTGMNRVGICARNDIECQSAAKDIKELIRKSGISVEGMFTHFSKADEEDSAVFAEDSHTKAQAGRFTSVRSLLGDDGSGLFCHVCNSAAAVRFSEFAFYGVRLGILLYGVRPSHHVFAETSPVMALRTVISHIHPISAGDGVSYGGSYVAEDDRVIAPLPIGYADGFMRAYGGAEVTVHTDAGDFKAPVIGRICMDQCMIDITNVPARVGDKITVLGCDSEDLSRLATLANTIEYEVLCLISGRVPRITKNADERSSAGK